MPNTTNRLQLQLPLGADTVAEIRNAITDIANELDNSVLITQGTLASIPTAGLAGRRYYANDVGIELWDTGTQWIPTGTPTPVGAIMQWPLSSDPVDLDGVTRWMVMNNRAISRTTYSALNSRFSGAGYPFGSGDGSTTFNLPEGRGLVMVGADPTGVHMPSHLPALASIGGEELHSLGSSEVPVHNHTYSGTTAFAGHDHTHGVTVGIQNAATFNFGSQFTSPGQGSTPYTTTNTTDHQHTFSGVTSNAGGNASHNNTQVYLAVNHIIKVL